MLDERLKKVYGGIVEGVASLIAKRWADVVSECERQRHFGCQIFLFFFFSGDLV